MEAKFSQRVKEVIQYSREEAIRLGHDYIGCEHLLLGIIREGEPPKQLVAGGEFFVLQRVERVEKVGDRLNISLEAPRVVES